MSGRVKFWELRGLSRPLGIQPAGPNSRRVARSVTLDDERAHSGIECSPCSFSIRPLVRHRPTEPLEVFLDVHRAPVSHSTVRAMRGGPLSSFTLPTIQDHSNVGIVVEGSRQICVELLITTRNDVEKPWHRPAPHSPWTSLLMARRRLGARAPVRTVIPTIALSWAGQNPAAISGTSVRTSIAISARLMSPQSPRRRAP